MNGIFVGYFRLRAFLTTLATLIVVRAVVDTLVLNYARIVSMTLSSSKVWEFLADGTVFGLPLSFVVAIAVAIMCHLMLSRMRIGWHIQSIGGSRRSAFNVGIPVRRVVCLTYVMSGVLTALGVFYMPRASTALDQIPGPEWRSRSSPPLC